MCAGGTWSRTPASSALLASTWTGEMRRSGGWCTYTICSKSLICQDRSRPPGHLALDGVGRILRRGPQEDEDGPGRRLEARLRRVAAHQEARADRRALRGGGDHVRVDNVIAAHLKSTGRQMGCFRSTHLRFGDRNVTMGGDDRHVQVRSILRSASYGISRQEKQC